MLCRVAVLEALYGEHDVPPGDFGYVVIVSVRRDEAAARLRSIRAILDALRVKYRETGDVIELVGQRRGFRVLAANVASVSGWTSIGVIADEVSKWRDVDSGSNPATEVLAALRPTLATMPNAREFISSSPVGLEDAHAKAFAAGDSESQIVAAAPTWIANPSLTEEATKRLEPDERIWRREYAAVPQGSALGAFEPDAIDAAMAEGHMRLVGPPVVVTDAASRGGDSYTACAAAYAVPDFDEVDRFEVDEERSDRASGLIALRLGVDGRPVQRKAFVPAEPVLYAWGWKDFDTSFKAGWTSEEIVEHIASFAHTIGASRVIGDQHDAYSLESLYSRRGILFKPYAIGANKALAVARLRRKLNERTIRLEPHDRLRRELLEYRERITPAGVSYSQDRDPFGGHFDHVAALVTLQTADIDGALHGAPIPARAQRLSALTTFG